jgi:hypothetical protein
MAKQASFVLECSQMLLHRALAELQPFRQEAGREGGLGGEIPQDQRIDRGSGCGADLRSQLRTFLRTLARPADPPPGPERGQRVVPSVPADRLDRCPHHRC